MGNTIFTEQIRSLLSFRIWAQLKPSDRNRFFVDKIKRERLAYAAVLQCERYKVMQGILDGTRIKGTDIRGGTGIGGRKGIEKGIENREIEGGREGGGKRGGEGGGIVR